MFSIPGGWVLCFVMLGLHYVMRGHEVSKYINLLIFGET
jgi:hypothetical protein